MDPEEGMDPEGDIDPLLGVAAGLAIDSMDKKRLSENNEQPQTETGNEECDKNSILIKNFILGFFLSLFFNIPTTILCDIIAGDQNWFFFAAEPILGSILTTVPIIFLWSRFMTAKEVQEEFAWWFQMPGFYVLGWLLYFLIRVFPQVWMDI